jgi:hypothetical protein
MRRAREDVGLTLVELLVVTAISGLVIPVLTGALVFGWRTTDATVTHIAESRNRQIAPSLFTRDAQNETATDTDGSDGTCLVAGDTLVVRFRWTETPASGAATTNVAAWVLTTSGSRLLERRLCRQSGGPMASVSNVTAAHDVIGTPSVVCRAATGAATACSAARVVDLAVTDASGSFTATGRRRAA